MDCSLLKQSIISLCSQWQSEFFNLLNKMAHDDMDDLYQYFRNHKNRMRQKPEDLDALHNSTELVAVVSSIRLQQCANLIIQAPLISLSVMFAEP